MKTEPAELATKDEAADRSPAAAASPAPPKRRMVPPHLERIGPLTQVTSQFIGAFSP